MPQRGRSTARPRCVLGIPLEPHTSPPSCLCSDEIWLSSLRTTRPECTPTKKRRADQANRRTAYGTPRTCGGNEVRPHILVTSMPLGEGGQGLRGHLSTLVYVVLRAIRGEWCTHSTAATFAFRVWLVRGEFWCWVLIP